MSFSPALLHSQNPTFVTHPALHIRDAHDAHVVLDAVRQNILPLIKRRLLASERDQLQSGHVYVWEEAQDDGGLLRWTDGRRWLSQSRMRGDYLFYEEKIETTQEERDAKAARRACRASDPNAVVPPPIRRKDRPSKPNGLTKQTYSVTVHLPGTSEIRKWHVVAYFSASDYSRLPVIEHYDYLRNIRVPNGVFISNKNLCGKPDRPSYGSDDSEFYDDAPPALVYAHRNNFSPALPTPTPVSPYPPPSHASYPGSRFSLPPIGSLNSPSQEPRKHVLPDPRSNMQQHPTTSSLYAPLSSEDRRALDKFRVIL
ncbi:cAMP-independent regulatory protein pac2 [Leucoagaricus sp. SymC.cos]|nr:cAMP-independent regulatory protein pac2 [Leucoagaricus sp. SymC.cos]